MESAIYQSMISAIKLLEKQTVIANNLANISTIGFKESFNFFIKDKNLDNINYEKTKKYYNTSPGNIINTKNNLDLIIKQDGWLVVKDANGKEAYTKNGHFQINSQGVLTIQNYEVIGKDGNIIVPNNANIKILPNGVIQKISKNENSLDKLEIGALKLVRLPKDNIIQNENGLFRIPSNRLHHNIPVHDNSIRIQSEMLEESNVNPTKNMIDMISNARQYEMNMKLISMCDQNEEHANQLFNINI